MKSRLEECLQRLHYLQIPKRINQDSINLEKRIAMRLLESMSIDTICNYRNSLGQHFAFLFAQVDFIEGIEHIAKHNKEVLKELLFEKAKYSATPFGVAIRAGSKNMISYFINNYGDALFSNELQEATIKNDIDKAKEILKSLDKIPKDTSNLDALEDAVLLNHFELVQLFFEDDKLHSQFAITPALEAAIYSNNEVITTYFINKLIERNEIATLQKAIDRINLENLLTLSFVKTYITILTQHTKLSKDDKTKLLTATILFIFKYSNYDHNTEFKELFNKIKSIIPDDKDARKNFKNIISSIIRSEPQATHYQRWQFSANQLIISLYEKCLSHPYLSCQDVFEANERDQLLVQSITNKQPAAFYYFLTKKNLTHHDDKKNNLAHFAAMADFDVVVHTLYKSKPELFKEENADHKLPLALLPNNSPLKTLMDPEWQTYHTIKASFVSQKCFLNTLIDDPKWGTIPCQIAEYLTQIENAISILNTSKLIPLSLKTCYFEITQYLFFALTTLWTYQKCNSKAISELLSKYFELGKTHSMIDKHRLFDAIGYFARYEHNDLAFALTIALLQDEINPPKTTINPPKPSRVKVCYLRLIMLGLYASKLLNMKSITPYYSDADIDLKFDQELNKSIIFRFLASTDSITQASENDRHEFEENIRRMDFTALDSNNSKLEAHSEMYFFDYIESCGVMLNWTNDFFHLTKEQMAQHKYAISIIELKTLFLKKLQLALNSLPPTVGAPEAIKLMMKSKIDFYDKLISAAIKSAHKSIQEIKIEMKPKHGFHTSKAKKVRVKKRVRKAAATKIDYSIFKPTKSIFDEKRFTAPPKPSNRLTSFTRAQYRFFDQKNTDYATIHHVEGLDLVPLSDSIYFKFNQYCDMVVELSSIVSHYLETKSPLDERTSHFIELTTFYSSSDPISHSVQKYKQELSDLIAWISSEQSKLQQDRSAYLNEIQQLEQSMYWYLYESNELEKIKHYSPTVNIGNLAYLLDLGYAQLVNRQHLDEVQENLSLFCDDIADIDDDIWYFESHAPKLSQAKNLLDRKLIVESDPEIDDLIRRHEFK